MRHNRNTVRKFVLDCLNKNMTDKEIISELCHKMGLTLNNAKIHLKKRKAEYDELFKKITVKSLMTGKDIEINANTPVSCRPDMETYWSM